MTTMDERNIKVQELTFTGRYGEAHEAAMRDGKDFVVIEYDAEQGSRKGASPDMKPGIYIREAKPTDTTQGVDPIFVDSWVSWQNLRAYNIEDAYRNFGGASCQWRAALDGVEGDVMTIPFQDERGAFPEDGGDGEYAAYAPDDEAKDGITREDIFGAGATTVGSYVVVPEGMSLRNVHSSPAP